MNPKRLREWMKKYGNAGVLAVAVLLGVRHLWRERRGMVIAVVLLVGTGVVLAQLAQRRSPVQGVVSAPNTLPAEKDKTEPTTLLSRAVRVADARQWNINYHDYYWLSDEEVLYSIVESKDSPRYIAGAYRQNLKTGARQRLNRLSRLTTGLSIKHSQVDLSPDRQWVFWTHDEPAEAIAVHTDDSQVLRQSPPRGFIQWLADSRRWVELIDNLETERMECLRVHDLRKPAYREIRLPRHLESLWHLSPPVVTTHNRYLMHSWDCEPGIDKEINIYEGEIEQPEKAPRKHRILLPPKSEIAEIVFSPKGDHIAWLLEEGTEFAIGDYLPNPTGPKAHTRIWVSRLDGSGMREIGSVSWTHEEERWSTQPYSLHWLPSGKKLSFLFHGSLWTVPAD